MHAKERGFFYYGNLVRRACSRNGSGARACAGYLLASTRIIEVQPFAMDGSGRKRLDHQPADWLHDEPDYFITLCADPRGQNHFWHPTVGPMILESVQYRNQKQIWYCQLAVLMPDHIHLLVSFPDLPSFVPVIKDWKHWLSRQHDISWQENFFDHRVREGEFSGDKTDYILQNPVRAGLIGKAEDWPYTWIAEGNDQKGSRRGPCAGYL